MSNVNEDEERGFEQRILEQAIKLSRYDVLDYGYGAYDNFKQNSNYIIQKGLKELRQMVHDYEVVRTRRITG